MNKAYVATDSKCSAAPPASGEWVPGTHRSVGLPGAPALESLILEGARLKSEIEAKTGRLRRINQALAESVEFKDSQRTAHLAGAGWHVKVRLHDNITWDQEKIGNFRDLVPEEKFAQLFKAVYEPASKKEIDGFIAHADPYLAAGLKSCMSIKPGVPQVSYDKQ
jgi:hypothetical protein